MSKSFVQESKLISKVTNYPRVSSLIETSKGYYYWGREVSSIVAFTENTIEGSIQWITPKVEQILQTESYKKFAQPALVKVDDLGAKALQSVEDRVEQMKTQYHTQKENLGKTVSDVKNVAYQALERVEQKVVLPLDDYLRDSSIGKPLNRALDVLDYYVPESSGEGCKAIESSEKKEIQEENDAKRNGPVIRATRLSFRIQRKAFAKLHDVSQKPQEATVIWIQYAANSLDRGVASLKQTVHKGLETGTSIIHEAPNVREKIQLVTNDALVALQNAIDAISKQVPSPIASRIKFAFNPNESSQGNHTDVTLFASVAEKSANLLHEASNNLSEYIARGEMIPMQILQGTAAIVTQIFNNLTFKKGTSDVVASEGNLPKEQ